MEKVRSDLNTFEKLNIVYHSIKLEVKKDDKGQYIYKNGLRFEKVPLNLPCYKDIKLETFYNKNCNSSIIPLGEVYDLIGIDIDNKNDTLDKYQEICDNNEFDRMTFTLKTMHDGYHEYYILSDKQKLKLKNFSSITGKIFNLNIDVKYNNQIFFGPSIIQADKEYSYEIILDCSPILLPNFIFEEILRYVKPIKKEIIKDIIKKNMLVENIQFDESNNKRLESYLNCLNNKRFEDYDDWIKIGLIIFNEKGPCELYDKFSKKGNNYDNSCFNKWKTFNSDIVNDKISIKSLIEMAKQDNFPKYMDAFLNDKQSILEDIFYNNISDVTCSNLFYCLFPKTYIYDMDNNEWYKINEYGIYQSDKNNTLLKDHINKSLLREIEKEFIDKSKKIIDEEQKNKLIKTYVSIRKYLLNNKNKINIINELSLLYKRTKIFEKFDNVNNYVLAFTNGVYDFKINKFRIAEPEELITCTTGYKYKKVDVETIDEIKNIIISIFPINEERKYLLTSISLGLIGDNPLEEMYIWIGSGQNGKGLLRDLISYMLGEYFDNAEIEYFCKTKNGIHANAADPVMARKKNSRIVITTEPEGDVNLKCAKLKQISGRDPVQVRDLYKSPFNFIPKFKLIIQTNDKPTIDGSDGGIVRRLRYITFPIKFVDEPKLANHRKIDRNLKSKIKEEKYRLAFFQILSEHYLDFVNNNNCKLDMPERIKRETQEYLDENDPLKQFIEEKIDITNNNKDFVLSSELFESFNEFNEGKGKTMTTIMFKNKLMSKGFTFKRKEQGNSFIGIKIKTLNSFVDDLDN